MQADEESIRQSLAASPGIEDVEIDLPGRTVSVVMANRESAPDIRRALGDAGFPPEDGPGDS